MLARNPQGCSGVAVGAASVLSVLSSGVAGAAGVGGVSGLAGTIGGAIGALSGMNRSFITKPTIATIRMSINKAMDTGGFACIVRVGYFYAFIIYQHTQIVEA